MTYYNKKLTRKMKAVSKSINKRYKRKTVTKKIKLNRKRLNKRVVKRRNTKKMRITKRRRSIKRGGEDIPAPDDIISGGSRCMAGGNDEEDAPIAGGNTPEEDVPIAGGSTPDEEEPSSGGMKSSRKQKGGSCGCGVIG